LFVLVHCFSSTIELFRVYSDILGKKGTCMQKSNDLPPMSTDVCQLRIAENEYLFKFCFVVQNNSDLFKSSYAMVLFGHLLVI